MVLKILLEKTDLETYSIEKCFEPLFGFLDI